jgi:hypothetical protein
MAMKVSASTLQELLALLPDDEQRQLGTLAGGSVEIRVGQIRDALYKAIDRIPARWGLLGKIGFYLIARPRLQALVDKLLDQHGLGIINGLRAELNIGGDRI